MLKLSYKQYFDKVYGCWLGKCVSGNIGAPYEGMKQILNYEYSPQFMENMLPNDDLDLQVLWLDILEKKGTAFTSDDLAQGFVDCCEYAPGEYAYFKKNFKKGIHPPLCGSFCNTIYLEGMGSLIRSEIWACVAAGNPQLAAQLAQKDAILDHGGAAVHAEQFMAAMEAAAFYESDMDNLVTIGLEYLPEGSRIRQMVEEVVYWCKESDDYLSIRSKLLREYGHHECTNVYQNIGIILLSLYCSKMDFIRATMMALNCGFDTDCTCATVGALIGIVFGGKSIAQKHGFANLEYKLGIHLTRRDYSIKSLAEDTCKIGLLFSSEMNAKLFIADYDGSPPVIPAERKTIEFSVTYENDIPSIGIGGQNKIVLTIKNNSHENLDSALSIQTPDYLKAVYIPDGMIKPGRNDVEITLYIPEKVKKICDTNIVNVVLQVGNEVYRYSFGLSGAISWRMYGPFWENIATVPEMPIGQSYWSYMKGEGKDENIDFVRQYHVNTFADLNKEYIRVDDMIHNTVTEHNDAAFEPKYVNTNYDKLSINDFTGFTGPCTIYLCREFESEVELTAGIQIGRTDAIKVWLNGELISDRTDIDNWTAENIHKHDVLIKKGINSVVLRLSRRTPASDFNFTIVQDSACTDHLIGFYLLK